MKIVILGGQFESWGGGIDLLRYLVRGLLAEPGEHEWILLLKANPPAGLPRMVVKNTRSLLRIWMRYFPNANSAPFNEFEPKLKIVATTDRDQKLAEIQPDLVIPCADHGIEFPKIGYVYDCQHRVFPGLFLEKEIQRREKLFTELVETSARLLVNSVDTRNDLARYYQVDPRDVSALPFAPLISPEWLESAPELVAGSRLPDRYFIICNQFWKHKDHPTALKALAKVSDASVHMICTGKMEDYRFPEYPNELRELVRTLALEQRVHFTGFIPKRTQVELMKNSLAVIQPTLFEGGPGGGAVYDAYALGVHAVVSDIPINRELPTNGQIEFFHKGDPQSLAEVLDRCAAHPPARVANPELLARNARHLKILSQALMDAIHAAVAKR